VGAESVVSSVEVGRAPARYPSPVEGFVRHTGEGAAHLFRTSSRGQRLRDVIVGEGALYHPSGLDYDGQAVWLAVPTYPRPDSGTPRFTLTIRTAKRLEPGRCGAEGFVHGVCRRVNDPASAVSNWSSTTTVAPCISCPSTCTRRLAAASLRMLSGLLRRTKACASGSCPTMAGQRLWRRTYGQSRSSLAWRTCGHVQLHALSAHG
jgi:hypothetical protein